jgi:hypothetical protein
MSGYPFEGVGRYRCIARMRRNPVLARGASKGWEVAGWEALAACAWHPGWLIVSARVQRRYCFNSDCVDSGSGLAFVPHRRFSSPVPFRSAAVRAASAGPLEGGCK